ncbi:MAG: amidohydrolase family protein [Desulfurococcales archaeon]|nr:amidohydrolase family protein [Desulfurococcales archaeon]
MGYIEAKEAIIYGRYVEGVRIRHVVDEYYDLIVIPGFSDGHMHPQVVDAGLKPGTVWRHSYEWFENRRLEVDEAGIRSDLRLSSALASLVFKRALLEGTTLVAVTGRLEANLRAWLSLREKPRAVFLPTVMKRRGWASVPEVAGVAQRYAKYLGDGLARIGVFVHSVRYGASMLRDALLLAKRLGSVVGIHVSEGLREMEELSRLAGGPPYPARIVGVHCMEEEDPAYYGVTCISCPYSNHLLYRRTRGSISGITGFGSDWPLLVGSVGSHIGTIASLFKEDVMGILKRATMGSYKAYSMRHHGDMVAMDGGLNRLLDGKAKVRLVTVNNRLVVREGRLVSTGESLRDVMRRIQEAITQAKRLYPIEQIARS